MSGTCNKYKITDILIIYILITSSFIGIISFDGIIKIDIAKATGTIIVDCNGNGNYTKIQDAIDAATAGDTIRVWSGAYYEHIIINKKLTLMGNGSENTIIDGGCLGNVVEINADWVNFNDFLITGAGITYDNLGVGIKLNSVENCTITNNTIENCPWGINSISNYNKISYNYLTKNRCGIGICGSYNKIFNNTCIGNFFSGISIWGYYNKQHNYVYNNTCMFNENGIYLDLDYSFVENNSCCFNFASGIHIEGWSKGTIVRYNNCSINGNYGIYYSSWWNSKTINNAIIRNICNLNNGTGILVAGGNIEVLNNTCNYNGIGISLNAKQVLVQNNTCNFNKEYYGIQSYYSNSNTIDNNTLISNAIHGIFLKASKKINVTNNKMISCGLFFASDYSENDEYWRTHEIKNNFVNGKPIYYLKDVNGGKVLPGAGGVILNNCQNIVIDNQIMSNGSAGIILINSKNNIIKNNSCNNHKCYGIFTYNSYSNIYENNMVSSNVLDGICTDSIYNKFKNNTCSFNGQNGIITYSDNFFINNTLISNGHYGISCENGGNKNILINNSMKSCGLLITGVSDNTIDTSNTVNDKPICYLINQKNRKVPPGMGQVILVYCDNITIENQNLSNGSIGITLLFSNNIHIKNCSCNGNTNNGIYLYNSNSNVIENNICNSNRGNISYPWRWDIWGIHSHGNGIGLYLSPLNFIRDNTCKSNNYNGIALDSSGKCSITHNICSDNDGGIIVTRSGFNKIIDNKVLNNDNGIEISCCVGTIIRNNTMLFCGFSLLGSDEDGTWNSHIIDINNTVNGKPVYYWININGRIIPSNAGGIILVKCTNITVQNQTLNNSGFGIQLYRSHYNLIKNNLCNSNKYGGIFMFHSNYNKIVNNICNFNVNGISFEGEHNKFIKNICKSNQNYGIMTGWLGNNSFELNYLIDNNIGIEFWDEEPEVGPVYKNSRNRFVNNSCMNNYYAVIIDASWGNNISNNNFSNNYYGIYFPSLDWCEWYVENRISNNNFISNKYPFDIYHFGEPYQGINITNNFWWDYEGLDNGAFGSIKGDGIGDTFIAHKTLDPNPLMNPVNEKLPPNPPFLIDPGEFDSNGKYQISWSESFMTSGYILEEDIGPSFNSPKLIYNGSNLNFEISGKTNATYYYRAKAFNNYGESGWSNIVNITVDWPPEIPKNLKAITYPPGNTLNLSWRLNNVDTVEYIIHSNLTGNWSKLISIKATNNIFNHTGLIDDKPYYYRIQAKDKRGQVSGLSKIIQGIPWDSVAPAPPKGLKVISTTHNSSYLIWEPNVEDDLNGYNIYRNKNLNPDSWGKSIGNVKNITNQYNDTGLDEFTTYYYVITAFDEVPNESGFSNLASGTTLFNQYTPEINNSIDDIEILEDTIDNKSINLLCWFKDKNNYPLVFWVVGNENISVYIYQNNGTVVLIPANDWNGKERLTFNASNGISNISDIINITVTPVNDPPGPAIIMSPQNGQEFENGTKINFSAICFDPDIPYGDKLTFEWSSNLSGEFGIGNNLTNVNLIPGVHQIILKVKDQANAFAMDLINITILAKSITDDKNNETPNNTGPDKPEINDTKNDTKPGKVQGPFINAVIIGTIIIVIIAIVILIIFLFVIKKKSVDKKEISEPHEEQKDLTSQENLPESKPPPTEPQSLSFEQPQPQVSETPKMPSQESIVPLPLEVTTQQTIQPELEQKLITTSETTKSKIDEQEPKADAQQDSQDNNKDNSPPTKTD